MLLKQIKKNLPLIFIFPSTHCILLQLWEPATHSLLDFLYVIWDFFIYIGVGALIIGLACGVIFSPNPIRSLFSLIGVFLSAIFLFLSIRVEFLSMIFLIVYVGAIAILFLFVIMLLNLKKGMPSSATHPTNLLTQWGIPLPLFIFSFLTFLSFSNIFSIPTYYNAETLKQSNYVALAELNHLKYYFHFGFSDAGIFSELFYGVYGSLFLGLAWILAVSMIGSIVLALSTSETSESTEIQKIKRPNFFEEKKPYKSLNYYGALLLIKTEALQPRFFEKINQKEEFLCQKCMELLKNKESVIENGIDLIDVREKLEKLISCEKYGNFVTSNTPSLDSQVTAILARGPQFVSDPNAIVKIGRPIIDLATKPENHRWLEGWISAATEQDIKLALITKGSEWFIDFLFNSIGSCLSSYLEIPPAPPTPSDDNARLLADLTQNRPHPPNRPR